MSRPNARVSYAGGVLEIVHSGRWVVTPVRTWYYRARSPYQDIAIGDVPYLGTCLFLDGWLQLAEADEYIYHEHLVIPALLAHPAPERVLILGGGDGLAAREVLRDSRVHQVLMVDLDAQVVGACRRYLAHMQEEVFSDPRLHVIIGDARDILRNPTPTFDVIIVDLVDLMPETRDLFEEIYAGIHQVLSPSGVVATHAPDPGPPLHEGLYMVHFLREQFKHVVWYKAFISSFSETWTFGLASPSVDLARIPARVWAERAQTFSRAPRSVVPQSLPAHFLHPPEEEEHLRRIAAGDPQAMPQLAPWQARIIDEDGIERVHQIVGFSG